MQRYTLVDFDHASPQVQEIYLDFMRSTGASKVPNWVKSLGSDARLLKGYWEKTKNTLVQGEIPYILKEMVIFVVSVQNGSRYCSACHAHAVLSTDRSLSFEDLDALSDPDNQRLTLPAAYRAALRFAKQVARDPNAVGDELFEALLDSGFSDEEVAELLSVIDLALMFNGYTSTLQLPLDPEYREVLEPLAA